MKLQDWLEQKDIEDKKLQGKTWILLMSSRTWKQGEDNRSGWFKEFTSIECLIVPLQNLKEFADATWESIRRNNPPWAWAGDDRFIAPAEYEGESGSSSAMYPVLTHALRHR